MTTSSSTFAASAELALREEEAQVADELRRVGGRALARSRSRRSAGRGRQSNPFGAVAQALAAVIELAKQD